MVKHDITKPDELQVRGCLLCHPTFSIDTCTVTDFRHQMRHNDCRSLQQQRARSKHYAGMRRVTLESRHLFPLRCMLTGVAVSMALVLDVHASHSCGLLQAMVDAIDSVHELTVRKEERARGRERERERGRGRKRKRERERARGRERERGRESGREREKDAYHICTRVLNPPTGKATLMQNEQCNAPC